MRKTILFSMLLFTTLLSFANPPKAEDVFQISAKQLDPNTLTVNWQIKPGFFLYHNKIKFSEKADSIFHLGNVIYPAPLQKTDRQGKSFTIYRNNLAINVPVLGEQPGEALLIVSYQGCADDGFCYPPQTKDIKLSINSNLALSQVDIQESNLPTPNEPVYANEAEKVFATHNFAMIILSFFGFGLLLAFTPCVLPMVPVLSGIIIGHGKQLSTRKAFLLSLSYVLSMAATYAGVGAIVALMGNNLQIVMQSPWVISLFCLIFVLLALSMFSLYELRLPLAWQSKFANITRSQAGGHYLGAAIMGSLSTLILSPCVTAPLIGALGYIAHTGNVLLGSIALFSLGIGMGTPLLLIGTSAGKLLPKAGAWMNLVKSFFGIMLLGVAIYLMERILPNTLTMALWGSLLVFSGIYLDALSISKTNAEKFRQGLGILVLVYGLLILIGASQGHTNPLQPLATNTTLARVNPETTTVTTLDEVEAAIAQAKGKPVMLDFYADWCASCKVIAATTLQDPRILKTLDNFVVLKVDLTKNSQDTKSLLSHFNIVAPPTFLFFDVNGNELTTLRLVGDAHSDVFVKHLNKTIINATLETIVPKIF